MHSPVQTRLLMLQGPGTPRQGQWEEAGPLAHDGAPRLGHGECHWPFPPA